MVVTLLHHWRHAGAGQDGAARLWVGAKRVAHALSSDGVRPNVSGEVALPHHRSNDRRDPLRRQACVAAAARSRAQEHKGGILCARQICDRCAVTAKQGRWAERRVVRPGWHGDPGREVTRRALPHLACRVGPPFLGAVEADAARRPVKLTMRRVPRKAR